MQLQASIKKDETEVVSSGVIDLYVYSLGFILWALYSFVNQTSLAAATPYWLHYLRTMGEILMLVSILFRRSGKLNIWKSIIFLAAITFLVLNALIFAKDNSLVALAVILVGGIGVDVTRFLKIYCIARVIEFVLTIIFSKVGILTSVYVNSDGRMRNSMGFYWVSYPAYIYLFIVFMLIWVYRDRLSLPWIALLGVTDYYIYLQTNTRSPYLLTLGTLLLFVLLRQLKLFPKILMRVSPIFRWLWFPGLVFLSYALTRWCAVGGIVDLLSTGRIRLGKQALAQYGIGAFGQPIIQYGALRSTIDSYFVIDSGNLSGLVTFGLLTMLVFAIAYFVIQKQLILDQQYFRLMVLWIIMLSGLSDPWINDWSYNVFVILFAQIPWVTSDENLPNTNLISVEE